MSPAPSFANPLPGRLARERRRGRGDGERGAPSLAGTAAPPPRLRRGLLRARGRAHLQLGEELRTAGPGELVFAPRGAVHTLANRSEEPARYLLICTPGGFERTPARRWAERECTEPPAWADGELPAVEVVGPPIEL